MTDIYCRVSHNQLSRVNTLWGIEYRAQTYEKSAIGMFVCVPPAALQYTCIHQAHHILLTDSEITHILSKPLPHKTVDSILT